MYDMRMADGETVSGSRPMAGVLNRGVEPEGPATTALEKLRNLRWASHVFRIMDTRNTYIVLVVKAFPRLRLWREVAKII
jgi:hypothetical protein